MLSQGRPIFAIGVGLSQRERELVRGIHQREIEGWNVTIFSHGNCWRSLLLLAVLSLSNAKPLWWTAFMIQPLASRKGRHVSSCIKILDMTLNRIKIWTASPPFQCIQWIPSFHSLVLRQNVLHPSKWVVLFVKVNLTIYEKIRLLVVYKTHTGLDRWPVYLL